MIYLGPETCLCYNHKDVVLRQKLVFGNILVYWFILLFTCLKEFYHFLLGWIGNHNSDFAETFHSPSLSGEETAVSILCSGNLSFRENEPMKFEILIFSPARRKFTQFFMLYWKPGFRFCWNFPQLFTVRTGSRFVNFLLWQFFF